MLCSLFFCREGHLLLVSLVSGIVNRIQQLFFFLRKSTADHLFFGPTTLKPKWLGMIFKITFDPHLGHISGVLLAFDPRPSSCVPPRFNLACSAFWTARSTSENRKIVCFRLALALPCQPTAAWLGVAAADLTRGCFPGWRVPG